jgi:hypothetical protein
MPIRPEHLFDAAQKLNALKPPLVSEEVCARTMANRAYYAAYLATREALRVQYANPGFDVTHRSLTSHLTRAGDPRVREIGSRLKMLRRMREISDYQPTSTVSRLHVALHLADARYVLDRVDRLVGRLPVIPDR